jgi:hypothetical protein
MVDLDDRTALGVGGPVFARLVIDGGGVCAGQGRILLGDSRAAVDKPSRIGRSFASDSATNLHFYNGIIRLSP